MPLIYNAQIHTYASTHTYAIHVCFLHKIFDRKLKNEAGTKWARLENRASAIRTQEGERERELERWERRREMKRAGVLFIHLPLHWFSLWKTETQRRNNKKGGGALSNHFSAHDISPSSCSSCPSLTRSLCLLCVMIFKATDMSGWKWPKKKKTQKRTADNKT